MPTDQEIMGRSVLAIRQVNVRYGSLADIRERIRDVRFTQKADMLSASIDVR
jgi:hypothetical protein